MHTAASSTFGPNNNGPRIKELLGAGDRAGALELCHTTGFSKNDFYIYTNTRGFRPEVAFSYLVLPTSAVLSLLSDEDPRVIPRTALLAQVSRRVRVPLTALGADR